MCRRDMADCAAEIQQKIVQMLSEKEHVFVAIDGRCAAGKTTLAQALNRRYGYPVVHMDDFFLSPSQRTEERLARPGENVDWERFLEEVVPGASGGKAFSYRPYDCGRGELSGRVEIPACRVLVAEGAYACHPMLRDHYDLRIFLDVAPDEQQRRILRREGAEKAEMFKTRWVPLEERYIEAFHPDKTCDMYFHV